MDTSREEQMENEMLADFAVSMEKSRVSSDQKRLCIRRGRHTESVGLNAAEAQLVIASLMQAFPGALNELIEAARPLADALDGDGMDLADKIHGVQAAIVSIDSMLAAKHSS
jgi:hypothetical protein